MNIQGRYQIGVELGEGGMGTVYKGLDTQTNQPVAIKQLKPELMRPELLERFQREGQALRDLNHPNIVKMLDAFEEDGDHYLIMEYVSGGDLRQLIEQGQLPIQQILQIAIDLADALTRAHRLDIIHRDLKPANVLIAEDGTPRLTDFGVAHMADMERVTDTNAIIGTIEYLAPEAFQGGSIDNRTDIWAFGVLLYEMLAGEKPFNGFTLTEVIYAIVANELPVLEDLREDIPIALVDLVYRMLERDKNARIASIRHVGATLEDILQGRDTQNAAPSKERFGFSTTDMLSPQKHNLASQITTFVGREAELETLAKLLNDSTIRLVTILASGGMGKTRLALEAARRYVEDHLTAAMTIVDVLFEDGVYFIELAPLNNPNNIISAIADATGYQFQQDERNPKQQVLDFLGNKNMLLVLDNFEHLLEAATLVTDILNAAPNVKIIVTSRQRLNLSGESVFNLAGMDFPEWETPEDAMDYAAVKLFVQSAKRVQAQFELTIDNMDYVARICMLVQGLPLGIVLAASWLGMLSVEEIAEEISQGIDFLESEISDLPERHRSIRAVFDYSWNLMNDSERDVFMKLSVFRGGFTREAAQAVTGAKLRILMNLMNKSLIHRRADNGRYNIHELLRKYGEDKLKEQDFTEDTYQAHANFFGKMLSEYFPLLTGKEELNALTQLRIENDNIRAAWNWSIKAEYLDYFEQAIDTLWLYQHIVGKFEEAMLMFRQAVDVLETIGNKNTVLYGRLLAHLGWHTQMSVGYEESQEIFQTSLVILEKLDAREERAITQFYLGWSEAKAETKEMVRDAIQIFRELDRPFYLAHSLTTLGRIAAFSGDYEEARRSGKEGVGVALHHQLGSWTVGWSLLTFVLILMSGKEYELAQQYCHDALVEFKKINERMGFYWTYSQLAHIATTQNELRTAVYYRSHLLQITLQMNRIPVVANSIFALIQAIVDIDAIQAVTLLRFLHDTVNQATAKGTKTSITTEQVAQIEDTVKSKVEEATFTNIYAQAESLKLEIFVQTLLDEFSENKS